MAFYAAELLDRPSHHAAQPAAPASEARPRGTGSVTSFQLATAVRHDMESAFKHDFGDVRVLPDGVAEAHGARAVTLGEDIHMAAAEGDVASRSGRRLLAHELAHVLHQRRLPGADRRSPGALEREADEASESAAAGRGARVGGAAPGIGPTPQLVPTLSPGPAVGNILYVGMNEADPEIKALQARYPATSPVKVTAIKSTAEQAATSIGGAATYDLTTDPGIEALAKALTADATKQTALVTLFKGQYGPDRDDLAHVAKVYADTEGDGKDRMTRVVLSGHSVGPGVFGSSGELEFTALVQLAGIFPAAANQTKHLLVAGCHTGDERTILDYYVKAFPSLVTVWAWWDACPLGPAAAPEIARWAGLTEHSEKSLPRQGGGMATWSSGVYEGSASGKAPAATVLAAIRADDARFNEYFDGTRADPGPHGGWLEPYYSRVFVASGRVDITGSDHDELVIKRQRAYLIRFWPNVAKNYWAKFGAVIAKGYGTATVPDYAKLSRKDAMAAIAAFPAASTAPAADQAPAQAALDALKNLDVKSIPDVMINP
jgi:Domain of unknown function (DUF4157)